MSLKKSYNLIINNIENFTLTKDKNNTIFDIRKTARYKYKNHNNKICSTKSIERKDLIINKIINLNFIQIVKKLNIFNHSENPLINKNNIKIENKPFFLNNNKQNNYNALNNNKSKYCKKNKNKKVQKNVLIKPIMVEGNNNPIIEKNETPKKVDNTYNKYMYYNNYNSSYNNNNNCFVFNSNNTFYSNPLFFNNNLFFLKNTNINEKGAFENKLRAPFIYQGQSGFFNFNQNYLREYINKKYELDKLNFNKEFIKNLNNLSNKFKPEKTVTFVNELNKSVENSNLPPKSANLTQNNHIFVNNVSKSKGRKAKNAANTNFDSKHTKYSADNMMRKIKNKVIESSRLLVNKVLRDEINNEIYNKNLKFTLTNREFRKIQGSFSQELNIKYNFWFYQISIKDIFCLEISNKYSAIEKSSNKELIDNLFSSSNENKYIKTKLLLNMPFHQFYHDIFLGQDPNWRNIYGIKDNENKYQIQHLLKTLEEEEKREGNKDNTNMKYINDIRNLAYNYEDFFLNKKPRNVDYNNKKNQFIKVFMNNTLNDKYMQLWEEVKQLKNFYENRNLLKAQCKLNMNQKQKSEETMDNSLMKKTDPSKNNLNFDLKDKFQIDNRVFLNNSIIINDFMNNQKMAQKDLVTNKPNINLDEKDENENNNDNNLKKIKNNYINEKNTEKTNTTNTTNTTKKLFFCNHKRKGDKIKNFISSQK